VFSTDHSIAVLNEAQQKHGLPEFDLILCDEAHRTTGQTFDGALPDLHLIGDAQCFPLYLYGTEENQ
jgi:predicted helicase